MKFKECISLGTAIKETKLGLRTSLYSSDVPSITLCYFNDSNIDLHRVAQILK